MEEIPEILVACIYVAAFDTTDKHYFICVEYKGLKLCICCLLLNLGIVKEATVDSNSAGGRIIIYLPPENDSDSVEVIALRGMDTPNFVRSAVQYPSAAGLVPEVLPAVQFYIRNGIVLGRDPFP